MENENNLNKEKYVIEIKSGLYVSRIVIGNTYSFTKDIVRAHKFIDLDSAKEVSVSCDGSVKECKVNYELYEVIK
ncbi:hypothetical protein AALK46_07495 [Staphylococcus nepalensis]|uniref:hypothetical protein n=1 Tax=Staphylococcus nepalensis TaxID=214473 RepID=UPI00351331A0